MARLRVSDYFRTMDEYDEKRDAAGLARIIAKLCMRNTQLETLYS